jgi:hypothetical protein
MIASPCALASSTRLNLPQCQIRTFPARHSFTCTMPAPTAFTSSFASPLPPAVAFVAVAPFTLRGTSLQKPRSGFLNDTQGRAVFSAPAHRRLRFTPSLAVSCPSPLPFPVEVVAELQASGKDAGLPLTYDLEAINAYWDKRPGAAAIRLAEIAGRFTPLLMRLLLQSKAGPLAAQLRDTLVALGPWYVICQVIFGCTRCEVCG